MKIAYRIYEIIICLPLILIATILTAVVTAIGCTLGNGHFWGYYPGKLWSQFILWILLIPVKVTGRENLKHGESYVFVSNHQGAFDIFLIYGHLCRNFKWMMKIGLRRIPLVGYACVKAHHIFVDKSGPKKIKASYDTARATLKDGMSLVVFPEGSRTHDGHIGTFHRGAYLLADELQLPVVPLTINGSFEILPRDKKGIIPDRQSITLTIHAPIYPKGKGADYARKTMDESREVIISGLEERYK